VRYKEPDYPWICRFDPGSMARAIIACWENYEKVNYRKWAEERHDAEKSTKEAIKVYEKVA
jgi:hypothetical protein